MREIYSTTEPVLPDCFEEKKDKLEFTIRINPANLTVDKSSQDYEDKYRYNFEQLKTDYLRFINLGLVSLPSEVIKPSELFVLSPETRAMIAAERLAQRDLDIISVLVGYMPAGSNMGAEISFVYDKDMPVGEFEPVGDTSKAWMMNKLRRLA